MKKALKLIMLSILIFSYSLLSQNFDRQKFQENNIKIGKVYGKVIDFNTKKPLEKATIYVYSLRDSSLVTGGFTNEKGDFSIEQLPMGKFFIKINFIGYKSVKLNNILINKENFEKKLGIIELERSIKTISEITVKAEKENLEYSVDKQVINVDKNIVSSGGNAIDVIETVPAITVNTDGSILFRGTSNINIMVDGKPSETANLEQIPATMIEKVEILTNPSAKYDPDGISGIINIILKKKTDNGYNGIFSVNVGSGNKFNSSINLNLKYDKFNYFINYDNRFNNMNYTNKVIRNEFNTLEKRNYQRFEEGDRKGQFHNIKIGTDYFINEYNNATISFEYNIRKSDRKSTDENIYTDSLGNYINIYKIFEQEKDDNKSYNITFNYKKYFSNKNRILSFDGFYRFSDNNENESYLNQQYDDNFNEINNTPEKKENENIGKNKNFTIQTDYIHPLNEKSKIELGLKSIFRKNDNTSLNKYYDYLFLDWVDDITENNRFIYYENINSSYLTFSNNYKKLNYNLGLRIEQAFTKSELKNENENYKKNYFSIFPTVHLNYNINKNQSLNASYSKRINRVFPRLLNPFKNSSDTMNVFMGNPYLGPEYIDSYELSYFLDFSKNSFTSTFYYRKVNDAISRYTILYPNGTTLTTYKNLNSKKSYGAEFTFSNRTFKNVRWNINYNYFKTLIDDTNSENNTNGKFSWVLKANTNINLFDFCDLQLTFNYNSATNSPSQGGGGPGFMGGGLTSQTKIDENYSVNLGVKKEILKGNGVITLRISDIFDTFNFNSRTYASNYTSYSERKRDGRTIFLGFSYKINGGIKQKKERKTENEEDVIDFDNE